MSKKHTISVQLTDIFGRTVTSAPVQVDIEDTSQQLFSLTLTATNANTDQVVLASDGKYYLRGTVTAASSYYDPSFIAYASLCQSNSSNYPFSNFTLIVTPASPQPAGTKITLIYNTGDLHAQYQFWVYNPAVTPGWTQLQAYSASTTCIWTPATAGLFALRHHEG